MVERLRLPVVGGNYFAEAKAKIQFIGSGSKRLDLALGGGWAEGRISNIVGDKSSGKTLLCIEASANFAQKYKKGTIYYRECEAAFDPDYAAALGMPLAQVDFGEPLETVEDVFEDLTAVAAKCLEEKTPGLYVLDSLDALSDRSEMERDMDQGTYGAEKAKKMSQLFRRATSQLSAANVTLLIVSQVRDKIGWSVGRSTTRSGGRALDFYASQVVYLSTLGRITKTVSGIERVVGVDIKAMVDKNKIALPFRDAEFSIMFGYGINDAASCVAWLAEAKALGEVGITPGETKKETDKAISDYLKGLNKLDDAAYWEQLDHLYGVVEKKWYEVEKGFLPTRRKYGRD